MAEPLSGVGVLPSPTTSSSFHLQGISLSTSGSRTPSSHGSSTFAPASQTASPTELFSPKVYQEYLSDNCIPLDCRVKEDRLRDDTKHNLLLPVDPMKCRGQSPKVKVTVFIPGEDLYEHDISTEASFNTFLQHHDKLQASNQTLFTFLEIPSEHSWSRLLVNYQLLQRIVRSTATKRSPYFLDILNLFGRKLQQINEDYSVCNLDPITKELNYNLTRSDHKLKSKETTKSYDDDKDFEQRNTHKWVLRKMAISVRDNTFVLIKPSDSFKRKLRISWDVSTSTMGYRATAVHLMAIEASNEDWKWCLNALEEKLFKFSDATHTWSLNSTRNPGKKNYTASSTELNPENIIDGQILKEEILHLLQAVRINLANMQYISQALETQFEDNEKAWMENAVWELQQVESRAHSITQRISCVIDSVPTILARQDNIQMWRLAKRAEDNARSVRVITIVTMVFLPITVMASVFSMTVFSNDKDVTGKITVSKSDLMWFGIATGALLVLTFVGWIIFELYSRKRNQSRDEEHSPFQ